MCTTTSPARSRPSHTGTRSGGFAPASSARPGIHSAARAGSSSTTLYTPGSPRSSAATVADAASSTWIHDHTPAPSPMMGSMRFRTISTSWIPHAGTVEAAVAEHDPGERRVEHTLLELADRRERLALPADGVRVERLGLGRRTLTSARDRPPRVALREQALHASRLRRGEQIPRAGGAERVRRPERQRSKCRMSDLPESDVIW